MEQRAERLVRRARNGDTEAFTQLILRNEEMLSRVALSLLHNMEDAADAVQDAILAAWQALPSLREPRYFRTWLVRILIRCCSQVGASSTEVGQRLVFCCQGPRVYGSQQGRGSWHHLSLAM